MPDRKRFERFIAHDLQHLNTAPGWGDLQLLIDETIIEADRSGIRAAGAKVHPRGPRPVNSPDTHGAGFARRINVTACELPIAECTARISDSDYFGVSRGVVC